MKTLASLAFVLLFISSSSLAKEPRFVVSTGWLAERIGNPQIVLLQIGRDEEYQEAHLPGALPLTRQEISAPMAEGDVVLELPSVSQLDSVFESKGITDHSLVVLYWGKDWVSPTARAWLTFDYVGFGDRTFILDGGMPAWVAEGRGTTAAVPEVHKGNFTPNVRDDVIVTLSWVRDHLKDAAVALIDSRNERYYNGEDPGNAVRAGHIPGARNVPYTTMVDDSLKFKPADELRRLLLDGGLSDGKTGVSYCHIGQQASVTYFVARFLGYQARMYDGSMNEWSRYPDLPMETKETAGKASPQPR